MPYHLATPAYQYLACEPYYMGVLLFEQVIFGNRVWSKVSGEGKIGGERQQHENRDDKREMAQDERGSYPRAE